MGFINNMFGVIAGNTVPYNPTVDFIPTNNKGDVIEVKGEGATWLGLRNRDMQLYAYEFCFPVASVVDRLAEMDVTGRVGILKFKGKGKNDYLTGSYADNMSKFFTKPNPLQTWEQFRGQQAVYKRIFGFCPVLPIVPSGFGPEYAIATINIPPWLLKPDVTGNLVYEKTLQGIVKSYSFTILGRTFTVDSDKVIMLTDGFMQDPRENYVLPLSKLVGLDMVVSNLCSALEADNVLLRKKGPLGFISHDAAATKDSISGYIPLKRSEKEELQTALAQYGLSWSQFQYVISRQPMRWNPMSFNASELRTKETVIQAEKSICHRFGFPYVLYEETDATYSQNGSNAAKWCFQNVVIPGAEKDYNKYADFFKAKENNAKFEIDYSHLPVLQQDEKTAASAALTWNEALTIEYKQGLITLNQWLEKRGYDSIGAPGDKRIGEDGNSQPLAVALGVGGTEALMAVLSNAALPPDNKRNALTILFGVSPQDAKLLVPDTEEQISNDSNNIDLGNINLE